MALVQCPECNREVSDQATACPKCGHPLRESSGGNRLLYFAVGIILLILCLRVSILLGLVFLVLALYFILRAFAWKKKLPGPRNAAFSCPQCGADVAEDSENCVVCGFKVPR